MKYLVYQIKNNINDKIYIGAHATTDVNDSYMGSGKLLLKAQTKYGIHNFTKSILYVFDTPSEMYDKEKELVNREFVLSEHTYNLKIGGEGGVSYTTASSETREKMSKAKIGKSRKMKDGWVNPLKGKTRPGLFNEQSIEKMRNAKVGRSLSEEHKQKISISCSGKTMPPDAVKKSADARKGKPRTAEQKIRIREAVSNIEKMECQYCGNSFRPGMFKRWHGDKCKRREL